jgi:hypothetical protein
MKLLSAATLLLVCAPFASQAQSLPPVPEQVAAAVMPLPAELRDGATVMGFRTAGKLEMLRRGTNGMTCLALYATRADFHVACYHENLEPFMARGRELRDQGVTGTRVDSVRFREIADGKLKMPAQGALYSLSGKKEVWDPAAGTVKGAMPLAVIYMPFATTATMGLTSKPQGPGQPWLMFPGTAKAHVMLVGSMSP